MVAARGLLDWSQHDLAEHSCASQTGIARIENGMNKPQAATLERIEGAFTKVGVSFFSAENIEGVLLVKSNQCNPVPDGADYYPPEE